MNSSNLLPIDQTALPAKCNLIWLNSPMREAHLERALEWKRLNPNYIVTILTDSASKEAIAKQLANTDIQIKIVDELNVPEQVAKFIAAVTNYRDNKFPDTVNNFSVPSDLYRFYLDGWYFDTDATPVNLSEIAINPNLPIVFNADRTNDQVNKLEPSAIGFHRDGILAKKAREILESMCVILNDPTFIILLNSYYASVRMKATQSTTGVILRAALGKIKVNDQPILHLFGDKDNSIPNVEVFDSLAKLFPGTRESSWLFSKFEKVDQTRINVVTLKGVSLDPCYTKPALFPMMFPYENNYILSIVGEIEKLYQKIPSTCIYTQTKDTEEKVVSNFNLFPVQTYIDKFEEQEEKKSTHVLK